MGAAGDGAVQRGEESAVDAAAPWARNHDASQDARFGLTQFHEHSVPRSQRHLPPRAQETETEAVSGAEQEVTCASLKASLELLRADSCRVDRASAQTHQLQITGGATAVRMFFPETWSHGSYECQVGSCLESRGVPGVAYCTSLGKQVCVCGGAL